MKGREHRNARRSARWLAVGVLCLLVGLNIYAPGEPTSVERFLGSLVLVGAAIPVFVWLRHPELTPFMAFWGLIYGVYYGLPVFLLERFSRTYYISEIIPDHDIEKALLLSLLGIAAALVGYYGRLHHLVARVLPKFEMHWEWWRIHQPAVGVALGVVGLAAYVLSTSVSVPVWAQGPLSFIGDLSLLSIIYLFVLQLLGLCTRTGVVLLWTVMVPLRFLLGVSSGATYQGFVVVVVLLLAYATVRRRLPVGWLVLGFAVFLVVRAMQVPFRAMTWEEGRSALGVADRISTMGYVGLASLSDPAFPREAWQIGLSRASHLMTFAEVVGLTPDHVPFWYGETYSPLVWKLVPRLLYPDKPLEVSGQLFGHRYGFLSPSDFVTAYNVPQLIEFYANFGVLGVALGMLLLGVLYRVVQSVFVHPRMGLGAAIAWLYLGMKLLLIESSFSMVVGGVLQALAFLWALQVVLKVAEARKPRSQPLERAVARHGVA